MGVISQSDYSRLADQVAQGGQAARDALDQLTGNTVAPSTPQPVSASQASSGSSDSGGSAPALPSWMGNQYSRDNNGYYSMNPDNPNAARYTSAGTPVATIGYSDQKTGVNFQGYGTPETAMMLRGASGDWRAGDNVIQSGLASGQLKPLSASQAAPQPAFSTTTSMPQRTQYTAKPLTPDQIAAQNWANNPASGQGGMASYINGQQAKLNAAYASGDQDMINRVNADMARVGYSLNTPTHSEQGGVPPQQTGQPGSIPVGTAVTPGQTGQPPMGGIPNQVGGTQLPGGGVAPGMPGQLTSDQIAAEAAARIAKQRAGISQAVNATKTGLKNSYDYTNQLQTDQRNLQDQTFMRDHSPFQGQTSYLAADMLRNRSIADTASAKDFNAATAAADQKLSDFDTMAPEQRAAIQDELTRIERDYGVKLGDLTGNIGGQRTIAGQQLDLSKQNQQFTQGMQTRTANREDSLAQNQIGSTQFNQQHTLRQEHIDLANALTKAYGVPVYPTEDPAEAFKQVEGKTPIDMQQLDIAKQNASSLEAERQAMGRYRDAESARQYALASGQLDVARQGNSVAQKKFDQENSMRDAEGTIASDLSKATSKESVQAYLNANASHFIPIVGQDTWEKMKNNALAQYDKVTPADKQNLTVREKAVSAAQNDLRWLQKGTDRNALIKEYEAYYQ